MKTAKQETKAGKIVATVPVIRKKIAMTPSEKQIFQMKGQLMTQFFYKISRALLKGMVNRGNKCSEIQLMNLGFKWNQNVVLGVSPNFKVNYKKVVISKGELSKPERATVKRKTKLKVEMTWNKTLLENAKDTDQMCWLEYNATIKEAKTITSETLRCSGKDILILEWPDIAGDEIHYWMFFISKDGRNRSDSVYLGILE